MQVNHPHDYFTISYRSIKCLKTYQGIKLTPTDKDVYLYLLGWAMSGVDDVFASQPTIAEELGIGLTSAKDAIAKLLRIGWISLDADKRAQRQAEAEAQGKQSNSNSYIVKPHTEILQSLNEEELSRVNNLLHVGKPEPVYVSTVTDEDLENF